MITNRLHILPLAFLLSACGQTLLYKGATDSVQETALIRPATPDERKENAPGFPFPPGTGLTGVTESGAEPGLLSAFPNLDNAASYKSVRVMPGKYQLRTLCRYHPRVDHFVIELDAKAGNEYVLECRRTKSGTRMEITEVPVPRAN